MNQKTIKKILVVDDDTILRNMLAKVLTQLGFTIIEASSGEEAVAIFQVRYPDAILMDIEMPIMNGLEACSKIRQLPAGKHVPIVMVTGLDDIQSIQNAYDIGATDFVTKPINWGTIGYSIKNVLRTYEYLQELQINEARFISAQELANLGSWGLDILNNESYCSTVLCRILDRSEQELSDFHKRLLEIVHPDDKAILTELIDRLLKDHVNYSHEYRIIDKNGAIKFLLERTDLRFNEKGVLTNIFGTILDITILRSLNSALEEKNRLLEDANNELTFLNTQLEQKISVFNRFVPREFLKILNVESDFIELGVCSEREITVMFTDIRAFTALTEKISLEEIFKFINEHLANVGMIIHNHHGFIDKFVGDSIMALFIDPNDAVNAAIDILKFISELNLKNTSHIIPYKIGIGVNTGTVMMGTVGEYYHIQTTVIGDTVNLASHVEGLTKIYGVPLLLTEATKFKLNDTSSYSLYYLDEVKVKQKKALIKIYEVLDILPEESRKKKLEVAPIYQEALRLYQGKEYDKARELFNKCILKNPDDTASKLYLDYIKNLIGN